MNNILPTKNSFLLMLAFLNTTLSFYRIPILLDQPQTQLTKQS